MTDGHALSIPHDSSRACVSLAVWEFWVDMLLCGALSFGTQLIATTPDSIVTVFNFTNGYAVPLVA